jgi:predicted RNase H-like nuclease (RuvC/YqgF family)
MNKERRKQLSELNPKLEELINAIEELKSEFESVLEEEQEYNDNIPENLRCSSKTETSDNAINALEEVISNMDDAMGILQDAISDVETAQE